MDTDLASLCQSCGLCCDGSLFGLVVLAPEEVEPARRRRLPLVASGRGFEQPCAALDAEVDGRRTCSIYAERPLSCRKFSCRLHDRHRREGGPLAPRLAAVRRVRELLRALDASGMKPADFEGEPSAEARGAAGAHEAYLELTRRLEEDFARA
jgi:uncharacterized protein